MNSDIKKAGELVHILLDELEERIQPGITGYYLNSFAEEAMKRFCPRARLACKNFHDFPASICVSINDAIIHAIPNDREFEKGDVVKIDLVIEYNGWYADSARTVICGEGNEEDIKLVRVTKECLDKSIKVATEGNTTGHIGFTIERHATRNNFSVMRDFSGHGIGKEIHMEPKVPCFGKKRKGYKLKEGDLICIEPMLFLGSSEIIRDSDGWTIRSASGLNTAHFEHTILITKKAAIIIT